MIIPAAWHFLVVHNHLLHIDHLHHTAEQLVVAHLQCREELAQVYCLLQYEEELVNKAAVEVVEVVAEVVAHSCNQHLLNIGSNLLAKVGLNCQAYLRLRQKM